MVIEFTHEVIAVFDDGSVTLEISHGSHPEVGKYGSIIMIYDGRIVDFLVKTKRDVDKIIRALEELKERLPAGV